MIRRAPFLLRGNQQLILLLGLSAIAALGFFAAAVCNYRALEPMVEAAAFSAHPSFASSGELIWRAILEINLVAAGVSVLAGCGAMAVALWRLEGVFRALSGGLARLALGERPPRPNAGPMRRGGDLLRLFESAADSLQRRDAQARALLETLATMADAHQDDWLARMQALHETLRQMHERTGSAKI